MNIFKKLFSKKVEEIDKPKVKEGDRPIVWQAHQDRVRSVTFLPNGQGLVSGSDDDSMVWWDLETNSPKNKWAFGFGVSQVAANPNGSAWGASFYDGIAAVWLLPNGNRKDLPKQMTAHYSVAFSPDGKWYAMGYHYGNIFLFPTNDYNQQVLEKEGEHGAPVGISFSQSSTYLVASYTENVIIVWDLQNRQVLRELRLDRSGGVALIGSPLQLVIGSVWLGSEARREYPDSVQVRNFETGEVLHELEEARGGIAVTADGKLLACCDLQGGVQLWDTANWRKLASFNIPGESAMCTAISFEHDRVACGTKGGSIAIFNVP